MPVINHENIVGESWALIIDIDELNQTDPGTNTIISAKLWRNHIDTINARTGKSGLLINPDDDTNALTDLFGEAALIAIYFPAFTDGRGYSHAQKLRTQHDYTGEIRAVGEILPDQLFFMKRLGFDTFDVDQRHNQETLDYAFKRYSSHYQGSPTAEPLYQKR